MEIFIKLLYTTEILLGELLFLQAYPRRERFPLRLLLATAASLVGGYCIFKGRLDHFFSLPIIIAISIVGMFFVFRGTFLSIFSACMAGVASQHIGYHLSRLVMLLPIADEWDGTIEFTMTVLLYTAIYLTVGRSMKRKRYYEYYDARITAVSAVIILICNVIMRFLRLGGTLNTYAVVGTSLYAITCCALALFIQFFLYRFVRVKSEYLMLQRISEQERRQYEISRENAELLNIKYHDLKHKLVSLEGQLPKDEIDSMRSIIETYDTTYHTGLDVLDIILNEKNLRCRGKGISLTCMGFGGEISFMDTMDVYSLFGNIIENAITAVEKISVPGKRIISLVIERKGNFVFINTVNYMSGTAPSLTDGLPNTTQTNEPGYHGYGLKSVRAIAQKHHGDISVSVEDDVFKVSIYMLDGKK